MATCKWCNRSGLFLKVSTIGLCDDCQRAIMSEFARYKQIIDESIDLFNNSKNIKTRLSRCHDVIRIAQIIQDRFVSRGIQILTPTPAEIIAVASKSHDDLLQESFEDKLKNLRTKHEHTEASRSYITALSKMLAEIDESKTQLMQKKDRLNTIEREIRDTIHGVKLNDFLEKARKAEFKGETKKALDQYMEALYFIKNDGVDDAMQAGEIERIETAIANLKETSNH